MERKLSGEMLQRKSKEIGQPIGLRRKIKQSDGRNQGKRKLLICSSFLAAAKWFTCEGEGSL